MGQFSKYFRKRFELIRKFDDFNNLSGQQQKASQLIDHPKKLLIGWHIITLLHIGITKKLLESNFLTLLYRFKITWRNLLRSEVYNVGRLMVNLKKNLITWIRNVQEKYGHPHRHLFCWRSCTKSFKIECCIFGRGLLILHYFTLTQITNDWITNFQMLLEENI